MSKPRLAIVTGPHNSATNRVMVSMIPHWQEDFDVDLLEVGLLDRTTDFNDYDLIHLAWFGYANVNRERTIDVPLTANIWQTGVNLLSNYKEWLTRIPVDRIVLDDRATRNTLGQLSSVRTELIPLAFDYPQKLLPFPEEFTIGYFGNNYPSKRFDIIDEAARLAGVKLAGFGLNQNRPVYNLNPEDLYRQMSCYVHASLCDTNSMPAMEALMHGRPVIATWSDGLARTLRHIENGLWFDGSLSHLVKMIGGMKEHFELYKQDTLITVLPDVTDSADLYLQMFHDVLDTK